MSKAALTAVGLPGMPQPCILEHRAGQRLTVLPVRGLGPAVSVLPVALPLWPQTSYSHFETSVSLPVNVNVGRHHAQARFNEDSSPLAVKSLPGQGPRAITEQMRGRLMTCGERSPEVGDRWLGPGPANTCVTGCFTQAFRSSVLPFVK